MPCRDSLIRNRLQGRRLIAFAHGDGDCLPITQCRCAAIRHYHVKRITAGPLRFGRRPGELARASSDGGAGRHLPARTIGQREGERRGAIRVRRIREEGQWLAFVDGLVADWIQYRGLIRGWLDRHLDDVFREQIRRPVVGHAHGEAVRSSDLRDCRRPREHSRGGIDRRAGREQAFQTVGQRITRQIRVSPDRREQQLLTNGGGLIRNLGQGRRLIDFAHGDGDCLPITQCRCAAIRHYHVKRITAGPLRFRRRPGEPARASSDSGAGRHLPARAIGQRERERRGAAGIRGSGIEL